MANNAIGVFGGLGYVSSGAEPAAQLGVRRRRHPGAVHLTFVLFNPGQQGTDVRFRFQLESGGTRSHTLYLPPLSRVAFDPRDVAPAADFATSLTADRPIVAERAYVTSGDGLYGALGHTAAPPHTDSRAWYFAEGNASSQIETYFVLFNLSTRPGQLALTYYLSGSTREQH